MDEPRKGGKHAECMRAAARDSLAGVHPCRLDAGTAPMQARQGTGTHAHTCSTARHSTAAAIFIVLLVRDTGLAECRCSFWGDKCPAQRQGFNLQRTQRTPNATLKGGLPTLWHTCAVLSVSYLLKRGLLVQLDSCVSRCTLCSLLPSQ